MPADEAGPLPCVPCVGFPTCTHLSPHSRSHLRYANTCCPPAGQHSPDIAVSLTSRCLSPCFWQQRLSRLCPYRHSCLVYSSVSWRHVMAHSILWPVLPHWLPFHSHLMSPWSRAAWDTRPHRLPFPASSAAWAPGLASFSSACCPGSSCTSFPATSLGAVHGPFRPPHIPELLWHFVDDVGLSQHPLTPRTQQAWCSGPTDLQNWIILNPEISISSKVLKSWC